jgi:hypothetical protein
MITDLVEEEAVKDVEHFGEEAEEESIQLLTKP